MSHFAFLMLETVLAGANLSAGEGEGREEVGDCGRRELRRQGSHLAEREGGPVMKLSLVFKVVCFLFIVGIVISAVSLGVGILSTNPERLGNAGSFASAWASIFGMSLASLALLSYVYFENVRTKVTDEAWIAKLRLEEAIHMLPVLLKVEMQCNGLDSVSATSILYGQALRNLHEALKRARDGSLYRVLAAVAEVRGLKENPAYGMVMLEAHVRHDLETVRKGIGQSVIQVGNALIESLDGVEEADIRKVFDSSLPKQPFKYLAEMASALGRLTPES